MKNIKCKIERATDKYYFSLTDLPYAYSAFRLIKNE